MIRHPTRRWAENSAACNEWLTLRLEVRDVIYYEVNGRDTTTGSVRNQLMTEVGFSLFFPTLFHEEG